MTTPGTAETVGVMQQLHSGRLDLPHNATAASVARHQVRIVLALWQLEHLDDTAMLIVSELVGNAVRHGRPPVWLTLERVGDGVRLVVHDNDSGLPLQRIEGLPDLDAEGGRGLFLIDVLAESHGVESIPGDGKAVRALVAA